MNKLRWSISTSFSSTKARFPFQDSQALATVFAQEILELVQATREVPVALSTPAAIRGFVRQLDIDKAIVAE